jgi:hypothetical protein
MLMSPAVSLEIWVIEYIWDVMEQRLRRLPNQPVTLANLGQALTNIWNNIPQASDINEAPLSNMFGCKWCGPALLTLLIQV